MVRVANQLELPEVIWVAADGEEFCENLGVQIKSSLKELQQDPAQAEAEVDNVDEENECVGLKRWWPLKSKLRRDAGANA
jgi:hypothetical protein